MLSKNFRIAGIVALLVSVQVGRAVAQVPAGGAPADVGPTGQWKGPLPIPGGSLPIQLSITAPVAGKLAATLDLPSKRLNRLPMSTTQRGDSLVLYAAGPDMHFVCALANGGLELRGTWTQPGLRVPLKLARVTADAPKEAAATQATAVSYHTEKISLTNPAGNVRLAGTLSIPDGSGPFPAAVLLSDAGPHDRDEKQGSYRFFADIAGALAQRGIAVLRLDDRGVGESGGLWSAASTADYVRDAQVALTYLRVRPSIDPARTGLIGHGEGGNVALLAAGQAAPPAFVATLAASGISGLELVSNQPEAISAADTALAGTARRQAMAAVLAEATKLRASGSNAAQVETYLAQQRLKMKNEERKKTEAVLKARRTMFEIVRQTANDNQAQAVVVNMLRQRKTTLDPAQARTMAAEYTTPWYRNYLKFDPQPGLAAVKCPVLLLHGTDDAQVNAATNLAALEKGLRANKRVTVRRLPGVNHWFQIPASELIANADGTVDALVSPVFLATLESWILQDANK